MRVPRKRAKTSKEACRSNQTGTNLNRKRLANALQMEGQRRAQEWDQRIGRRKAFPSVVFLNEGAPASLVAEAERAVTDISKADDTEPDLRQRLESLRLGTLTRDPSVRVEMGIRLGELIYGQLNQSFQSIFRMAYDIEVDIGYRVPDKVTVVLRALEKIGSRVFCSPRRYTVNFNGQKLVVAFRDHAIERIGQRTVMDPDDYASRGQAFAIPYRCCYFELVELPNRSPAAKIWNWCDPTTFLGSVHAELLGPGATARKMGPFPYFEMGGNLCYYLVGYCPARRLTDSREYLVLDSLWIPGMDHTPEFEELVNKRNLSTVERARFSKRVSRSTYAGLYESRDFDLLRDLHAVVPQVKPIYEPVFDYASSERDYILDR